LIIVLIVRKDASCTAQNGGYIITELSQHHFLTAPGCACT
jgi:hypothetical protein